MVYYVQYTFLGQRYASRVTANSVSQAKKFIRDMYIVGDRSGIKFTSVKKVKNNPSIPKNKWVKAKAIKINHNGSVSIKR